jgi:hypothetical protein
VKEFKGWLQVPFGIRTELRRGKVMAGDTRRLPAGRLGGGPWSEQPPSLPIMAAVAANGYREFWMVGVGRL